MKNSLILLATQIILIPIYSQSGAKYQINGMINGIPDGTKIYLSRNLGNDTVAVALLEKSRFYFEGKIDPEGEFYFLKTDSSVIRVPSRGILMENSVIEVSTTKDKWPQLTVRGSKSHEDFLELKGKISFLQSVLDSLNKKYDSVGQKLDLVRVLNDSNNIRLLELQLDQCEKEIKKATRDRNSFIVNAVPEYSNSLYIPYLLVTNENYIGYVRMKNAFEQLSFRSRKSYYGILLEERVAAGVLNTGNLLNISIFSGESPEGKLITLQEMCYNSKFILIDFWASWCHPCREENPRLRRVYDTFHKKGLEILSITSDSDLDAWKNAIRMDKMTWKHMSNSKSPGAIAKLFNISAIPAYILIDSKGKIVETDYYYYGTNGKLRDGKLEQKLAELIPN